MAITNVLFVYALLMTVYYALWQVSEEVNKANASIITSNRETTHSTKKKETNEEPLKSKNNTKGIISKAIVLCVSIPKDPLYVYSQFSLHQGLFQILKDTKRLDQTIIHQFMRLLIIPGMTNNQDITPIPVRSVESCAEEQCDVLEQIHRLKVELSNVFSTRRTACEFIELPTYSTDAEDTDDTDDTASSIHTMATDDTIDTIDTINTVDIEATEATEYIDDTKNTEASKATKVIEDPKVTQDIAETAEAKVPTFTTLTACTKYVNDEIDTLLHQADEEHDPFNTSFTHVQEIISNFLHIENKIDHLMDQQLAAETDDKTSQALEALIDNCCEIGDKINMFESGYIFSLLCNYIEQNIKGIEKYMRLECADINNLHHMINDNTTLISCLAQTFKNSILITSKSDKYASCIMQITKQANDLSVQLLEGSTEVEFKINDLHTRIQCGLQLLDKIDLTNLKSKSKQSMRRVQFVRDKVFQAAHQEYMTLCTDMFQRTEGGRSMTLFEKQECGSVLSLQMSFGHFQRQLRLYERAIANHILITKKLNKKNYLWI